MAALSFRKASKTQSKLRLALVGLSGSGKTYTALRLAKGLGGRVAVIDTERGSASKYAGEVTDFDVLQLESYAPMTFVEAIRLAEAEGYDVLIIDSLSHAWMGKEGALEQVDKAAKRSQAKNSFAAWREVTPQHNAMVDAILQSRCHVIVTMRVKTEYVLEENERGKKEPKKVGLAPIQRDGLEYEMDVVADLDHEHNFIVSKTRCAALDRYVERNAGDQVAERLKAWLTDGAPAPERPEALFQRLVRQLREVRSADERTEILVQTEASWPTFTRDEKIALKQARDVADQRLRELEVQRREAEEADRALAHGGDGFGGSEVVQQH
jgi:KaiC/GvpD/RAD55 family RecA-like ATPase